MPIQGHREASQSAQLHRVPAPLSECLYTQGDMGREVEAVNGCGRGEE